ncbi:hypothetical protein [Leucobacter insecticola]|uniref:hypothetical protein n=1 Tax=Leucobacter insecticola TaxID=2714934 RepID=UPI001FCAA6BB|nr:hypothetical protein [Leucobacter insecticola]
MSARTRGEAKTTGKRVLISVIVAVVLLGGLGAAGTYLWSQFGDRISLALGWTSNDYEGAGRGETIVVITEGRSAKTLQTPLLRPMW